jgi:hypothetical protein
MWKATVLSEIMSNIFSWVTIGRMGRRRYLVRAVLVLRIAGFLDFVHRPI